LCVCVFVCARGSTQQLNYYADLALVNPDLKPEEYLAAPAALSKVSVYVCVYERERESARASERARERERASERERGAGERGRGRGRGRGRDFVPRDTMVHYYGAYMKHTCVMYK
jgi:hypothetical protein